jgi:hypothetical protein
MAQAQNNNVKKFSQFLESTPPYTLEQIADLFGEGEISSGQWIYPLEKPDIQLHCETCQGPRYFQSIGDSIKVLNDRVRDAFLSYICRNCRQTLKTYAVRVKRAGSSAGEALKYGELPAFGPATPARVITLIGPDRDLFLRARRVENLGFGIGSFAYYRRVVENQKGRIIPEISKASAKLGASPATIEELRRAASETQFSKAIDEIKTAMPTALLIDGHNPLTLLHTALSEGLHAHTDEECLELAQEIRLVLTELAERISQALKEEAELKQAVTRLLNRKRSVSPTDDKPQSP